MRREQEHEVIVQHRLDAAERLDAVVEVPYAVVRPALGDGAAGGTAEMVSMLVAPSTPSTFAGTAPDIIEHPTPTQPTLRHLGLGWGGREIIL